MNCKLFIIVFISFFACSLSVNASSITYNLNIDKDLHFNEDVVYKVSANELNKSGDYDFLTSVVKETIYFDQESSVKYEKTSSKKNGIYTVHLKNNYSYIFLASSRILNECFSSFDFDISNENNISFETSSPFYCRHRADDMTINITTPLKVISNNADNVSNNKYTWNNINDDFTMNFSVAVEDSESGETPLDNIPGTDEEDQNTTDNQKTSDTNGENRNNNKESSPLLSILVVLGSLTFIIVITFVYLKTKNNKANKL